MPHYLRYIYHTYCQLKGEKKYYFPLLVCFSLLVLLPAQGFSEEDLPWSNTSIDAYSRAYPRLTKALSRKKFSLGDPIFIRIFKQTDELEVWLGDNANGYRLFKTYIICYKSGSLGPKTMEGDRQSPEGFYTIGPDQMNPWSKYHLSFNLGYPNEYDLYHQRTGTALMIHGRCSSVGCYAMTDYFMDEIYILADAALANGLPNFQVHIFPFKLTDNNLAEVTDSRWLDFWKNLKQGYDLFERNRIPPEVGVEGGRYVFWLPNKTSFARTNYPEAPSSIAATAKE